jgi:hypothetical protein
MAAFWVLEQCILVEIYGRFRNAYCLRYHGIKTTKRTPSHFNSVHLSNIYFNNNVNIILYFAYLFHKCFLSIRPRNQIYFLYSKSSEFHSLVSCNNLFATRYNPDDIENKVSFSVSSSVLNVLLLERLIVSRSNQIMHYWCKYFDVGVPIAYFVAFRT